MLKLKHHQLLAVTYILEGEKKNEYQKQDQCKLHVTCMILSSYNIHININKNRKAFSNALKLQAQKMMFIKRWYKDSATQAANANFTDTNCSNLQMLKFRHHQLLAVTDILEGEEKINIRNTTDAINASSMSHA